jgi:hypothetical protein
MRFRENRSIVKDERWRQGMSAFERFSVAALSPLFWIVTRRLLRYERQRTAMMLSGATSRTPVPS